MTDELTTLTGAIGEPMPLTLVPLPPVVPVTAAAAVIRDQHEVASIIGEVYESVYEEENGTIDEPLVDVKPLFALLVLLEIIPDDGFCLRHRARRLLNHTCTRASVNFVA